MENATKLFFFFFQAEDGIRDSSVTGVQTCALPISQQLSDHGGRPQISQSKRRAGCRHHVADAAARSEEHTSELQSHLNLVCRLLLEKKKKNEDTSKKIKMKKEDKN